MNASKRLPYDIAVVGLGIAGTHQITREAEEVIQRSNRTFVLDSGAGVVHYLRSLGAEVVDLMPEYRPGLHRRLIYRKMASRVVAAALERAPVCFAAYGHPKMYCHPTTLIQRAARVLDLKVAVFPGISSLDTLLVDLNVDPGFDGLQLYDATDLLVRRRPLQIDVSCIIMQAPIVLEATSTASPAKLENLRRLQSYLLEFYPADHNAVLVVTRTHPLLETVKQAFPLGKLAAALHQSANLGTIFIPPLRHRDVADRKLADRVRIPDRPDAGTPSRRTPERRPGRPKIGPQPS